MGLARSERARSAPRRRPRAADDDAVARFFHGLSDRTRIRILRYLLDGPRTAGEIVRYVGRHQPGVSSHLTCLRFCGFVDARRHGRNVSYAIVSPDVRRIVEMGERYLETHEARILACRVIAAEAE